MAPYNIGLQAYKEQAINTMTSGEMLILLYDEMIKRLKKAEILAKNQDYDNFETEVKRTQEIVTYLNSSLDRKYEISKNLIQLYDFFNYQMIRLVAGRNLALIGELIPLIEELREAYREADKLSKANMSMRGLDG
jgi:flagellar protein FliS